MFILGRYILGRPYIRALYIRAARRAAVEGGDLPGPEAEPPGEAAAHEVPDAVRGRGAVQREPRLPVRGQGPRGELQILCYRVFLGR